MDLVKGRSYFVSVTDTVIREKSSKSSAALNHLLLGDWMRYLGEETARAAKMRCRGCDGWVDKKSFSDQRLLEVNFIDIGQGDGCHIVTPDDQVILIDAGVGDNMIRFLSWRYNLRSMKVIGIDGVVAGDERARQPFPIDHVVISHPDKDHYYGFKHVFDQHKLAPQIIYHNGLVERPIPTGAQDAELRYYSDDDLGGYLAHEGEHYIWDMVHSNSEMHALLDQHPNSRKKYLSTLRAARENNPAVKFKSVQANDGFLANFEDDKKVKFKLLGPLTEKVPRNGQSKQLLRRLGDEGVTKNGHSVILQLQTGKLKVMLGGDLNTQSEDFLLHHYAGTDELVSKLEEEMFSLMAKGNNLDGDQRLRLAELQTTLNAIVARARKHLQVDVTKACHHGSHHFSETFLQVLNPLATVISSGDGEGFSHPRPDALGSFGRYGRGIRPLIFSTELARSTNEFCDVFAYFELLKDYERRIAEATSDKEKRRLEKEMQERKDRNVAVYGMITLRTDGEKTILAQKLEAPRKLSNKWDIHELRFNEDLDAFEYVRSSKAH
jgi:beta-lactamase superfamily II metal-dependent hydrolase